MQFQPTEPSEAGSQDEGETYAAQHEEGVPDWVQVLTA